ncbi:PucR family transcriptional regulator [Williamsia soli]|uniref:PucR family transcriptional regulator n=1 Tax=Williamsia soli TaxID=364929 RepID=UPI001A9ECE26|nr:helix-turn-helix domain-containing protein [Williamsia soli]
MPREAAEWASNATGNLLGDMSEIARQVTSTIRDELPAYEAIPVEEHRTAVAGQLSVILLGIRDLRGPRPSDLLTAERLGRRRAEQGIAVAALLQAYELPLQELWRRYERLVQDGAQARQLIALAPLLLGWLHQVSGAAATGHQIVTASQLANDVRLHTELLERIHQDPSGAESISLAEQLSLQPQGSFQAVCFIPASDAEQLERLHMGLSITAGPVVAGILEGIFVVLQQQDRTDIVSRMCRPHARGRVMGTGQRREGLSGAGLSIGDARRAADLAVLLGRDVVFAQQWLLASVLASAEHLDHLDDGVLTASANPHLTEAVLAFANNSYSTAAAARALNLHPNTVSYRLDRWTSLTGWDLRVFDGLARSVVSILLSARG